MRIAKWRRPTLNQILFKYDEETLLNNLNQKCLILGSKILLNVLHNTSLTVLLPWQ